MFAAASCQTLKCAFGVRITHLPLLCRHLHRASRQASRPGQYICSSLETLIGAHMLTRLLNPLKTKGRADHELLTDLQWALHDIVRWRLSRISTDSTEHIISNIATKSTCKASNPGIIPGTISVRLTGNHFRPTLNDRADHSAT